MSAFAKARWITTPLFASLPKLDLLHRELPRTEKPSPDARTLNSHVFFTRRFDAVARDGYILRISADDYYKLYINGRFVCQGPSPAYHTAYNFNEVDISEYLVPGGNVIAAHVYYQGLINRVWNSGDGRQGMIAEITRGGAVVLATDGRWLYRRAEEYISGGTVGYDTAFLENLDFTKKDPSIKSGGGDGWEAVVCDESDDHIFAAAPADTLDIFRVPPQSVEKTGDGWFIDFGRELVGQFYASAHGARGQLVEIRCGEETEEDNPRAARHVMRCNCDYREVCTLSGGEDEFEFYDYKAFRYVNAVGEGFDPASFSAVVRHRRWRGEARIETDSPLLRDIWTLCRDTLYYAVQEVFPDCPTREKGQYLGDFTVSGLAYLHMTGDCAAVRKGLFDFAESAKICDGLMAVSPGSLMQEIADFSLQYPLQVLNYYRYSGDAETAEELLPVIDGLLRHFAAFGREDGLLVGVGDKWNLVDWPKNLRDGYDCPLTNPIAPDALHCVINAFYLGALISADELRGALGLPSEYSARIDGLRGAFDRAFFDPESGLYADRPLCQYRDEGKAPHFALHSSVLPAFFGFCRDGEAARRFISEKGLCCGVQFAYFVLGAAARLGDYELEYRLLTNTTDHSWAHMLSQGATTLFEAWGKEQKSNCSLCHPWAASPVIALCEHLQYHPPAGVTIKITPPAL